MKKCFDTGASAVGGLRVDESVELALSNRKLIVIYQCIC